MSSRRSPLTSGLGTLAVGVALLLAGSVYAQDAAISNPVTQPIDLSKAERWED